ncbi:hypothetical protein [Caulobacter sp. 17J80-11]|uniref:hypothetical protein n=1 Tax=Caulobacter sp. 17J80-11 TaxID=2763502 RepID=UPI001653579D|nr:hypothetical protein [Caulobacter sp. 17J80-11]MBC6981892.1 hypothetical protein [Caulobacter sp. 17J80-11]
MRFLASLVVATVMLVAGPAAAQAAWTNFKSVDYGFSVDLPGEPAVTHPPIEQTVDTAQFTVAGDGEAFMIMIVQFRPGEAATPGALDTFLDGVVTGANGRETSRETTRVSGKDARKAAIEFESGAKGSAVAFIHGDRAYIAVGMRAQNVGSADVERMVASFRLMG